MLLWFLGNPYSQGCEATISFWQDCKAIMFLVYGKVVRQPIGSSSFLDPLSPINELIFGLGV
jgi:hypothetical protein